MKKLFRICALLLLLGLLISMLTGCDELLQSDKFLACDRLASQVAKGQEYTKEDVIAAVGRPYYFENSQEGADYMDSQVTWWSYEVAEYSGYHWRLSLVFDSSGNVTSAEFYAPQGG